MADAAQIELLGAPHIELLPRIISTQVTLGPEPTAALTDEDGTVFIEDEDYLVDG